MIVEDGYEWHRLSNGLTINSGPMRSKQAAEAYLQLKVRDSLVRWIARFAREMHLMFGKKSAKL